MLFVCPKCKQKLNIVGSSAVCPSGHSYDRSRKGYYNLLLSQGGYHGDNREMVLARRRFLDGGFYRPLALAVAELVSEYTECGGELLDMGCGEGYYTEFIAKVLADKQGKISVSGFDISKEAVMCACGRGSDVQYAVAGSYDMPVADASVDTAVNMFSPLAVDEINRVLKPTGVFIMAIPGEEHLFGLKSKLYSKPYKNTVQDTAIPGLQLVCDRSISYQIELNSAEEIKSLFAMTPYAYRTDSEGRERLNRLESLVTDVDFRVFVYRKI